MLDWNDLHPYNAVHVVHFSPLPDLSRLRQAIQTTLAFHGLTRLTLGGKRRTFTYAGGQTSCELTVLEGDNPQELLRAEIERQINTPFDCHGAFEPFRFFVVRDGAGCYLGLVYFHAVADAVSIVRLLRHIHGMLTGNSPSTETPVRLLRDRSRLKPWSLLRKLKAFAGKLWHHRHSVRVAHRDVFDGRNRYEMLSLDASRLRALSAAAKAWGVTINDIFLAAVLQCCSPFTLNRFAERARGQISIGCIVNTRADLELADPNGWGLMLGSFVVTHATPEGITLRELARDVRAQTRALKERKDYVGASPELWLGRLLLGFFSTPYRTKLYQKHYPLWGGVTNMNLNLLWPQPADAPPVDCVRGVSTGPVTPLVLSVTTVRDVVNLGLTFRATTFAEPHIRQVKRDLVNILQQLEPQS